MRRIKTESYLKTHTRGKDESVFIYKENIHFFCNQFELFGWMLVS
jgi:hypothetical protein